MLMLVDKALIPVENAKAEDYTALAAVLNAIRRAQRQAEILLIAVDLLRRPLLIELKCRRVGLVVLSPWDWAPSREEWCCLRNSQVWLGTGSAHMM